MGYLEKISRLSRQAVEMSKYRKIAEKHRGEDKYKNMWLISERGIEAKDNGYVFFKYLRENHPEINAWFLIDSSHKKDYDKVKDLGNIIEYGSLEHKIAFFLSDVLISSHTGFLEPWNYKLYKLIFDRDNKKKFVFLQHGVILSDLSKYYNSSNKIDLFITTTKAEYESICQQNYGFDKGVVVQTGLARYDNLNEFKLKKQILLMPSWRMNIITPSYKKKGKGSDTVFSNSEYFKALNSLINNGNLIDLLESNGIDMIFYPHFEMQPYNHLYDINSDRIVIADREEYDVQTLLKESLMMITDISSVAFDFAYMKKPLVYYQKVPDDKYNKGYFDYVEDGFGEVILDEENLIDTIESYFNNGFEMKDKYVKRVDESFNIRDNNNSQRIFDAIIDLIG